jgi:hypothetical protein
MATARNIVQIIWHFNDDPIDDKWYDICPDTMPGDTVLIFARIVAALERVGVRTETHVLCEPQEEDYDLTEAELVEIHTFDYKAHALETANPPTPVLIAQRFVVW